MDKLTLAGRMSSQRARGALREEALAVLTFWVTHAHMLAFTTLVARLSRQKVTEVKKRTNVKTKEILKLSS